MHWHLDTVEFSTRKLGFNSNMRRGYFGRNYSNIFQIAVLENVSWGVDPLEKIDKEIKETNQKKKARKEQELKKGETFLTIKPFQPFHYRIVKRFAIQGPATGRYIQRRLGVAILYSNSYHVCLRVPPFLENKGNFRESRSSGPCRMEPALWK
jgi:hypothetical protein